LVESTSIERSEVLMKVGVAKRRWARSATAAAVAMAAVLIGSTVATGSRSSSRASGPLAGKTVVLAVYWLDSYGSALADWTKKAVEAEGGTLQVINPNADAVKQANSIQNAITQHVAGIMWQPIDAKSASPLIQKIHASGIPLVLFGSYVSPKQQGTNEPQVIIDDYAATYKMGQAAAHYVAKTWPGQPPKVVAFNDNTDPLVVARVAGFMAGLRSVAKNTQVVFDDNVQTGVTTAQAKMQDIITAHPDFNVVLGTGGDTASGMMAALQAAGRAKAVNKKAANEWIGLIDGTPQELQELFDPSTSVEQVLTVTPKENASLNVGELTKIITSKLKPTSGDVVKAAGVILPTSCTGAVAIFMKEYGIVKGYKPPKCS
jgi:ribose transport system substrate-binding protein